RMAAGCLDLIVYLTLRDERPSGGGKLRYVSDILEVQDGFANGRLVTTRVFGPGPDGRAVPPHLPERLTDRLRAVGYAPRERLPCIEAGQGAWGAGEGPGWRHCCWPRRWPPWPPAGCCGARRACAVRRPARRAAARPGAAAGGGRAGSGPPAGGCARRSPSAPASRRTPSPASPASACSPPPPYPACRGCGRSVTPSRWRSRGWRRSPTGSVGCATSSPPGAGWCPRWWRPPPRPPPRWRTPSAAWRSACGPGPARPARCRPAPAAPAPVADAVRGLAVRLRAGTDPAGALRAFAADLADPVADQVVAALLLHLRDRGQHLQEVLSAVAADAATQVALRREIHARRTQARATVRFMTVFGAVVVLVLARTDLLAVYTTPAGQVVLVALTAAFVGTLAWVRAMSRPAPQPRFLPGDG